MNKPKFKRGQQVSFILENRQLRGIVSIIDEHYDLDGTNCYDVWVEQDGERLFVKHIREYNLSPVSLPKQTGTIV